MVHGPWFLALFIGCGDLNEKSELHLISKIFRIFEEGYDVYKSVFQENQVVAVFGMD